MRILKACGVMVGLFAISYVPAFAAVSILRPSNLNAAVPMIITISLLAASLTLIIFLTRPTWVAADFGLAPCGSNHVLAALAVGAVSGMVVIVATRLSHAKTGSGLHIPHNETSGNSTTRKNLGMVLNSRFSPQGRNAGMPGSGKLPPPQIPLGPPFPKGDACGPTLPGFGPCFSSFSRPSRFSRIP